MKDLATLRRIKSLVIPPAWTDVWICPSTNGHLQATGRDARGRKQYRYHARFRAIRDETKYERILAFAEALPAIRARVDEDLGRQGLPREKVLATIVRLLEMTLIRVGNEEYARANSSFGLTTLRNRHVDVAGSAIRFRFRGKSGKDHAVEIQDRRVARIVSRCTDLPGQLLFQYLDDEGEVVGIESADVNDYIRAIAGSEFTAKDFRTWAGTVLTAVELVQSKTVVEAIKVVSARLGNTVAVCRRCYVHPEVLVAFEKGELELKPPKKSELSEHEAAVLALLSKRSTTRLAA